MTGFVMEANSALRKSMLLVSLSSVAEVRRMAKSHDQHAGEWSGIALHAGERDLLALVVLPVKPNESFDNVQLPITSAGSNASVVFCGLRDEPGTPGNGLGTMPQGRIGSVSVTPEAFSVNAALPGAASLSVSARDLVSSKYASNSEMLFARPSVDGHRDRTAGDLVECGGGGVLNRVEREQTQAQRKKMLFHGERRGLDFCEPNPRFGGINYSFGASTAGAARPSRTRPARTVRERLGSSR